MENGKELTTPLVAGAFAGLSVDVILYPIDTIKTRLQSKEGFAKAGGFRGIYAGLSSAAVGSAPTAAIFFLTYEFVKCSLNPHLGESIQPLGHMVAASCGEVVACSVRVPTEVVKQRAQATRTSPLVIFKSVIKSEGVSGLYRGYFSTVLREVPFSFIQFPLWEYLKKFWSKKQGRVVDPWQSSVCGAVAGGVSACVTTPLDVAKTRIMLAETGSSLARGNIVNAMKTVFQEKGMSGLFAGAVPRTIWISLGGAIFLGVYEKFKALMS